MGWQSWGQRPRSLSRSGGLYREAWPEKAEKPQPRIWRQPQTHLPRTRDLAFGRRPASRMPAELKPEWLSQNQRLAPPGLPKDHLLRRPTPILAKLETSLNVLAARRQPPEHGVRPVPRVASTPNLYRGLGPGPPAPNIEEQTQTPPFWAWFPRRPHERL